MNAVQQRLMNYTLCLFSVTSFSPPVQQFARSVGDLYLTLLITSPACCLPLFLFSIEAFLGAFGVCQDRLTMCGQLK
jgi:hypothetical protein